MGFLLLSVLLWSHVSIMGHACRHWLRTFHPSVDFQQLSCVRVRHQGLPLQFWVKHLVPPRHSGGLPSSNPHLIIGQEFIRILFIRGNLSALVVLSNIQKKVASSVACCRYPPNFLPTIFTGWEVSHVTDSPSLPLVRWQILWKPIFKSKWWLFCWF